LATIFLVRAAVNRACSGGTRQFVIDDLDKDNGVRELFS
jgi:hypothetical protein